MFRSPYGSFKVGSGKPHDRSQVRKSTTLAGTFKARGCVYYVSKTEAGSSRILYQCLPPSLTEILNEEAILVFQAGDALDSIVLPFPINTERDGDLILIDLISATFSLLCKIGQPGRV